MSVAEQTSRDSYYEPEPALPPRSEQSQPLSVFFREIVEVLLLTFLIFWLVNSLVGRYRIDGNSMNPTLFNGEYLIINNFVYDLDEPQRGDIIVFKHPRNELNLIKRVIGLPGDVVEINGGRVQVNGTTLDEPYIQDFPDNDNSWVVPEDQYFVMGDNRDNSSDSRAWGFLPKDHLLGKALFVYWPPDKWGKVPHYDLSTS
jgi:signal peptidase I